MITNFKDFSLNESGTYGKGDFKKVYSISNFTPKGDLNFNSYEDISIELIRMERLFMGQGGNLVGANLNHIIKTLNGYVKTKMYNKLVEMMYSKGYANPTGDTNLIKGDYDDKFQRAYIEKYGKKDVIYEKIPTISRGEYFKKTWAQLDKYCENSVEFLVKNQIEDTTGDIISVSKWVGFGIAIAIMHALTFGGSSATLTTAGAMGAADLGMFISELISKKAIKELISQIGKLTLKGVKWATKFIKKIFIWILTSPIAEIIAFGNIETFTRLSAKIQEELEKEGAGDIALSENDIDTIDRFHTNLKKAEVSGYTNNSEKFYGEIKEKFTSEIERINIALQQNSDFYLKSDWSGITNMPGWKTWKEKTNYKGKASDLGYVYTWWISYYCTEFEYFCYYYFFLKEMQNKIRTINAL